MKLITFAVPSFNSEAYLGKCVDSLLVGGEDVEILIVNDGSHDGTADIANAYQEKYPTIVRAIHKENGGHGSGVNRGLQEATGLYYKVVDSDDWLDGEALKSLIATIKGHVSRGEEADMYITNFIYDKVYDGTQHVSEYRKQMPVNEFFAWKDIKPLRLWKMLLMHSIIYKTEKVRQSGVVLPEHTFYVDNLYAYQPLPYMKRLYYMDINLYHYYIGRSDQSVTIENMVKRYDQQIRVMECMLKAYTYADIKAMGKQLARLMFHILEAIMLNTYFFTTAKDSVLRRVSFERMWAGLKARDKKLYNRLKYHTLIKFLNPLNWKLKGVVTTFSYKWLCKYVKLGV